MNTKKIEIELLAPAKNLENGMAAISHGADAVYIGAKSFGARQAAGNPTEDIEKLTEYAHKYGAKVYVTVNTIIYDNEISDAKDLILELSQIGVDAILVQDMAIVELAKSIAAEHPEIHIPALHASTQTDNRNAEKVKWLKDIGFERVVLARELSLSEIKGIHDAVPDVELEVFVHGALCVSYSGACYASQFCFKRSANRGECAQFCRLPFTLRDGNDDIIIEDSHLLSLKDLNQLNRIGEIIESGAVSLKIEGRLKDVAYIKNVVAAYSQELDKYISQHSDRYCRSSYGHTRYTFTPQLSKTFNRGFTHYFLDGRREDISSFLSPKAMGEYVGYVKEIKHDSFNVAGTATFANGDGLCFFTKERKLEGFRVNRASNNRLYPLTMPRNLRPGMALYRNNDIEFERIMTTNTAERKISVVFTICLDNDCVCLKCEDETGRSAQTTNNIEIQEAHKSQHDNIVRQLDKLGNTIFQTTEVRILDGVENIFIPSSVLSSMRRNVISRLESIPFRNARKAYMPCEIGKAAKKINMKEETECNAEKLNLGNVANHIAEDFYRANGISSVKKAYETMLGNMDNTNNTFPLMTCRYCLRFALGHCIKHGGKKPTWKEPLHLVASDGRKFKLTFNCAKCQMEIYACN